MQLGKVIIVCGRICSGKSIVANTISKDFQYSKISFGDFIRAQAIDRKLDHTRASYQNLGQKLLSELGAQELTLSAIGFARPKSLDRLVFEGVRNLDVLNVIRNMAAKVTVIYLDVEEALRYERFLSRDSGSCSLQEFRTYDSQPIESGVDKLAESADYVIRSGELQNNAELKKTLSSIVSKA